MTRSLRLTSLLLALPASLLAACADATPGVYGKVDFAAEDCGQDVCAVDDLLAVGGTIDVSLRGVDDASVEGLRLATATDRIAEVVVQYDVDGVPHAIVRGNRRGTVDLLAVDRTGTVVDKVTLTYLSVRALEISVGGDRLDGPTTTGDDDRYVVDADSDIVVDVAVLGDIDRRDGDYVPLVGKMTYLVEVDSELATRLVPGDSVRDGRFGFVAPAGRHVITISTPEQARSLVFETR